MVGAFLLMLRSRRDWLQVGAKRRLGAGTRQALSSLRRAVAEVIFCSPELNDHTFFNLDLKYLFDCRNICRQCIEIAAISCNKYTDVRLFYADKTAPPEDQCRARS